MSYWTTGCLILIKMHFQTTMNGVAVIVCAIIGIVSCKRNELGIVIVAALHSTESKPFI